MIKKKIKFLTAVIISFCFMIFCGCSENEDIKEYSSEEISYVTVEEDMIEDLTVLINSYYIAVQNHSYNQIMEYTTEDFQWNYDQTGFEDYCRYISSARADWIDVEHITHKDEKYNVFVKSVITYDSPHTDEDGTSQNSGDFENRVDFVIESVNGKYMISDIQPHALG